METSMANHGFVVSATSLTQNYFLNTYYFLEWFNQRVLIFQVMQHRKVQKCIQLFNAMSMVFVHYENIYHDAWYKYAGQVSFMFYSIFIKIWKYCRFEIV